MKHVSVYLSFFFYLLFPLFCAFFLLSGFTFLVDYSCGRHNITCLPPDPKNLGVCYFNEEVGIKVTDEINVVN